MSWREVAKEFGYEAKDAKYVMEGPKRMAEEIVRLREENQRWKNLDDIISVQLFSAATQAYEALIELENPERTSMRMVLINRALVVLEAAGIGGGK